MPVHKKQTPHFTNPKMYFLKNILTFLYLGCILKLTEFYMRRNAKIHPKITDKKR